MQSSGPAMLMQLRVREFAMVRACVPRPLLKENSDLCSARSPTGAHGVLAGFHSNRKRRIFYAHGPHPRPRRTYRPASTRRIVDSGFFIWVGLSHYGNNTLRRTKASSITDGQRNLRAVKLSRSYYMESTGTLSWQLRWDDLWRWPERPRLGKGGAGRRLRSLTGQAAGIGV